MRIFIAGATGVLGRRVVKLLAANGHQVAGHPLASLALEGTDFGNHPINFLRSKKLSR